jgi:hypothetical protein
MWRHMPYDVNCPGFYSSIPFTITTVIDEALPGPHRASSQLPRRMPFLLRLLPVLRHHRLGRDGIYGMRCRSGKAQSMDSSGTRGFGVLDAIVCHKSTKSTAFCVLDAKILPAEGFQNGALFASRMP